MNATRGEIEVERQIGKKRLCQNVIMKLFFFDRQTLVLKEEVRMSDILLIKGQEQRKSLLLLETKGK